MHVWLICWHSDRTRLLSGSYRYFGLGRPLVETNDSASVITSAKPMPESTDELIPALTPGETFDRAHIFELDEEHVDELRSSETVNVGEDEMYDVFAASRRRIIAGDRAFVIRASYLDRLEELPGTAYATSTGIVEGEGPVERMNLLTLNTWLARFDDGPERLIREGDASLNASIVARAVGDRGAGSPGRAPFRAEEWVLSECGIETSRVEAEATGFFSGMWSCCSCGIADDSSTYLWVWGGVPLLEVRVDSGSICSIELLPPARGRRGTPSGG